MNYKMEINLFITLCPPKDKLRAYRQVKNTTVPKRLLRYKKVLLNKYSALSQQ